MQTGIANRAESENKFKMADNHHIGNRKFAISPKLFNQLQQNFAGRRRY